MAEDIIETRRRAITKTVAKIIQHQKTPKKKHSRPELPTKRPKTKKTSLAMSIVSSVVIGVFSVALDLTLGVLLVVLLSIFLGSL